MSKLPLYNSCILYSIYTGEYTKQEYPEKWEEEYSIEEGKKQLKDMLKNIRQSENISTKDAVKKIKESVYNINDIGELDE